MAEVRETGEVIEREGPLVKVRMKEHERCPSCGHKTICFPAGRHRILLARAKGDINTGDTVSIIAATGPAVLSSLLVFIGPVLVVLGMVLLTRAADAPLWLTIAAPIIMVVAYFLFLSLINHRLKKSGWFLPRAEKTVLLKPKEAGK